MAFKFVALFATLALANAGYVHEQPAVVSYAAPIVQKTVVAPASAHYTKTVAYTEPKAYIAHQPAVYHHEPQHHYAAAPAYYGYEHGHSEQNIVRTAHGTVSQISKHVDTPHSSVRKYDTRITNDGYKTVQYAHQPIVQTYAAPVVEKQYVAAPVVHKTYAQPIVAAPVVHKTYTQPIVAAPVVHKTYTHQPAVVAAKTYVHEPVHHVAHAQYAAHSPIVAQKVHYSPAIEVAHASFESPVVHYSW